MTKDIIGIDISKATLDAHRLGTGAAAQFANSPAGLRALRRWIGPQHPFHELDLQLFHQPGVAEKIFRPLHALQKFVQDFFRDRHSCFLLVKHEPDQSYTKDRTLSYAVQSTSCAASRARACANPTPCLPASMASNGGGAATIPPIGRRPTPPNRCLSAATACLHGLTEAAVPAAGYSPAIGILHTGKPLSFVYDIADPWKLTMVAPQAFKVAGRGPQRAGSTCPPNGPYATRAGMRSAKRACWKGSFPRSRRYWRPGRCRAPNHRRKPPDPPSRTRRRDRDGDRRLARAPAGCGDGPPIRDRFWVVQRRSPHRRHSTASDQCVTLCASIGRPAALHSGHPSSSRRTLKPRARRAATASKDRTHQGPRQ